MPTLPPAMRQVLAKFAPHVSRRVWSRALVLIVGAILAPGRRTVAAALSAMGLEQGKRFERDHRVLSRTRWSGLAVGRTLLSLLPTAFAPDGPLLIGLDETVERRRGAKSAAQGIDRDPVRSRPSHFVKASGRRSRLPDAARAHPVGGPRLGPPVPDRPRPLRTLRPATRSAAQGPDGDAAIPLLARCRGLPKPITVVTRLRLDAALDEPAPPRRPRQPGRPRLKGERLPTLAAVAAPATAWASLTGGQWYGTRGRAVEVASGTAVWYHGLRPRPRESAARRSTA